MIKRYFIEVRPDGTLMDNVLMSTHDLDSITNSRDKPKQYRFILRQSIYGPCLILHKEMVFIQNMRIIEGKAADDIARIDEDIKQLHNLKAFAIREARKRKAEEQDFHTRGQEVKEDGKSSKEDIGPYNPQSPE